MKKILIAFGIFIVKKPGKYPLYKTNLYNPLTYIFAIFWSLLAFIVEGSKALYEGFSTVINHQEN